LTNVGVCREVTKKVVTSKPNGKDGGETGHLKALVGRRMNMEVFSESSDIIAEPCICQIHSSSTKIDVGALFLNAESLKRALAAGMNSSVED
jgi:hypothetical protein